MRVAVVDTGFANYHSVCKALEQAGQALPGLSVVRERRGDHLAEYDKLVVPGQGAFKDCALALGTELREALIEQVRSGRPYLGICVGLQLLFEGSDEAPGVPGLGLLCGHVRRIADEPGQKIPHMGWNQLLEVPGASLLAKANAAQRWFYFVHSYHAVPSEPVVAAVVEYGRQRITAAVAKDNIVATQFHPEKSQDAGLALLRTFLES